MLPQWFNQSNSKCPHCNVDLGCHPKEYIRYDRTLQELVNKLFPDLTAEDAQKEEAFYAARGIKRKVIESGVPGGGPLETAQRAGRPKRPREPGAPFPLLLASFLRCNYHSLTISLTASACCLPSSPPVTANAQLPGAQEINFRLTPQENLPANDGGGDGAEKTPPLLAAMDKPYLKTAGNLKVPPYHHRCRCPALQCFCLLLLQPAACCCYNLLPASCFGLALPCPSSHWMLTAPAK